MSWRGAAELDLTPPIHSELELRELKETQTGPVAVRLVQYIHYSAESIIEKTMREIISKHGDRLVDTMLQSTNSILTLTPATPAV